jgi:hypothetical protein
VLALQSDDPGLQVYEHDEPLQLAADAFVSLHASPQALQSLVEFSCAHVLPHNVPVQVHAPVTQSGVGCAHAIASCQAPLVLQVCVVLTLQFVWPGAHWPEQMPLTQVWLVHATPFPHVPPVVHVWTSLPVAEHVVWFGAHTPVHRPFMHV